MTHTQRLEAAIKGEWLDKPCFSFWGPHYNLEESNAKDLAYGMIAFQEAYDFDFIKIMESGMYLPEAFGQDIPANLCSNMQAWLSVQKWRINHAKDWYELKPLKVEDSEILSREVEVVKRIADHFQGDVPILPTIFSPVSAMGEFVGGFWDQEKLVKMFEYHPNEIEYGLSVVEETLVNIADAFLDAGAYGLFFGMQNGLNEKLGYEMFRKYEWESSARVMNAVKDKCKFSMAHLCNGNGSTIPWSLDLPCTAINYADQQNDMPSLGEVRKLTDKVLVGGIKHNSGRGLDRQTPFLPGGNDFSGYERRQIKKLLKNRVKDAIEQAGDKLVIAGGCGMGYDVRPRFSVFHEVMDEIAEERAAACK